MSGVLGRDGPPSSRAVDVAMPEPVVSLHFSRDAVCALLQSGGVRCWGSNFSGQHGVVPILQSAVPLKVD